MPRKLTVMLLSLGVAGVVYLVALNVGEIEAIISASETRLRTSQAAMQRESVSPPARQYPAPDQIESLINKKFGAVPESRWTEAERALYRGLLQHGACDVLVVPFQVQHQAFDVIARSLMTRYLAEQLESAGLRVPDPDLVAAALGDNLRTFDRTFRTHPARVARFIPGNSSGAGAMRKAALWYL